MKKVSQTRANMESKMVIECYEGLRNSTKCFREKNTKYLEYAKYLRENIIEKEWFLKDRMNTTRMLGVLNQYIIN